MLGTGWKAMAALALAGALVGCTAPPVTPAAMVVADPPAIKPNWVVKQAVAIGDVAVVAAPNAAAAPAVGADALRQALERSLAAAGYLADRPKPRYKLDATLQELDQPRFSLAKDTTVTATVLYRLIGPGTNAQY